MSEFNGKLLDRSWNYKSVCNEEFIVMQFNVLADGLAQTGNFEYCKPENLEWEPRWAMMMEEIDSVKPDLLCCQEVNFPGVLAQHLEHLGNYSYFNCPKANSPAVSTGAQPDGCVMLINNDRFEVLDAQIVYYKLGNGINSGGIVVGVKDKKNGSGLVFSTTHLKAKASVENENIRCEQISQLLLRIKGMRQFVKGCLFAEADDNEVGKASDIGEPKVILTGDFNSSPAGEVYKTIFNDSGIVFESAYNSCVFKAERPCLEDYISSEVDFTTFKIRKDAGIKKETIDYIWVSRDSQSGISNKDLDIQCTYSLPSMDQIGELGLPSASYPSDHLSISAKIGYRALN